MNLEIIKDIVVGRIEPQIYAFTTEKIPNYLKVGDTGRGVAVRLKEWSERYPQLKKQFEGSALVEEGNAYFRDFEVHKFLKKEGKTRLQPQDCDAGVYYSEEFFRDATASDVQDAIDDINKSFRLGVNPYGYNFQSVSLLPVVVRRKYLATEDYTPRPNQQEVIDNFLKAYNNGKKSLLMYAVMRFGKSFTAMCCAKEIRAKVVVIVSAKADVGEEWKRTIETHKDLAYDKDSNPDGYQFFTVADIRRQSEDLKKATEKGKPVVLFLTLQYLNSRTESQIKEDIFNSKIDLLIVDETHFGARAEKLGRVLEQGGEYVEDPKNARDTSDRYDVEKANGIIRKLDRDVTLHLSGTPYRILMGDEFTGEEIISFCQFSDIVKEQEEWFKNNSLADDVEEWDNPYFGFPQMIRFAFNPSKKAREKLAELRNSGETYAYSALLRPVSVRKDDNEDYKKFIHEDEVLDILKVIDGEKDDDELMGFLNYKPFTEGNMLRHIVMVLPYCASCDAMEKLIADHASELERLSEYSIINISGLGESNTYATPEDVKAAIGRIEKDKGKTITLTVNRMLTGSTVREWDTMLYFKDTSSPQEYDQAVFRLQNQYVVASPKDKDGKLIKINMKPQTVLVDFDPVRMFRMEESKAQIAYYMDDNTGNYGLERHLENELRVSPIFAVNHDRMVRVETTDIIDAVRKYRNNKGVKEEATEIPVDLDILDDSDALLEIIKNENDIGAKNSFAVDAVHGGSETDIVTPEGEPEKPGKPGGPVGGTPPMGPKVPSDKEALPNYSKKLQNYYSRILLYAFVTESEVRSLHDVSASLSCPDNVRIIGNLGLTADGLNELGRVLSRPRYSRVLRGLDYKINNLNSLSRDAGLDDRERVNIAMNKFVRLDDAIVITPPKVCERMVKLLPDDFVKDLATNGGRVLDVGGVSGEFAVAVTDRIREVTDGDVDEDKLKRCVCTVPKSSVCYELTRMVYRLLGFDVDNIATKFTSFDMVNCKRKEGRNIKPLDYCKEVVAALSQDKKFSEISLDDKVNKETRMIGFDTIMGNPPYQGVNHQQLYPFFYREAIYFNPKYIDLIFPRGWQQPSNANNLRYLNQEDIKKDKQIVSIENIQNAFRGVSGAEWVNVVFWRKGYDNKLNGMQKVSTNGSEPEITQLACEIKEIEKPEEIKRLARKVKDCEGFVSLTKETSPSKPYGLRKDAFKRPAYYGLAEMSDDESLPIKIYGSNNKVKYVADDYELPRKTDRFLKYKVFVGSAWGNMSESAGLGGSYAQIIIASPKEICTETYVESGCFDDFETAQKHAKYLMTQFARALLYVNKTSQMSTTAWDAVPKQDYSESWWNGTISEINEKLFTKYKVDDDVKAFVKKNIQIRDEDYIVNFKKTE